MKLPPARINAFLQKPDAAVRAVLIYGPDAGLVKERADALARKIADPSDPFRTALLTGAMIAEDPARLADEMNAQALGGGRRLVRLQSAADNISAALASFLADAGGGDSLLVIEAGDLDKRSKLRALCEGDSRIACAIPCYVEDGPARQRAIGEILQASGVRAPRDVILFLADILPPDRLAMRSELEKLVLYVGFGGQGSGAGEPKAANANPRTPDPEPRTLAVTLDDVRAAIADAGAAEIDDLVHAAGAGDAKRAMLLLDRLFSEQTAPVAVMRALQRHFLRLALARGHMEGGASAEGALAKLQPPVFWKHKELMAAQVRRWPPAALGNALSRLYDCEAALKRTGSPDQALCAQTLLALASKKETRAG